METLISAIVCTHNRSNYLRKAVQSLVDQTLPKEQYEIIVVDNGSTDNTKALVESFGHLRNLRYIYEPIPGLSQARNTGWKEAEGQYVAYLDDDAIACADWLERIVTVFKTVHPRPGSVGGKIEPIWEAERPVWLSEPMEWALGVVNWKDKATFLSEKDPMLFGSNIAIPRDVLERIGGFSIRLGRRGNRLLAGEEELLERNLRKQNLGIYYDPAICVRHHVLAERLEKGWFYRRFFWHGVSSAIAEYYETYHDKSKRRYLVSALANVFHLCRHPTCLVSIFRDSDSKDELTRKCYLYANLGRIWAQTRIGLGLQDMT